MDDRPEITIAPRDKNHKTYFLLHQQDEVRLEIEDGNLILIHTDAYGDEAKIYVGCAYIDHFSDILTWALKDYWHQPAQRHKEPAPPTAPDNEPEPPRKRSPAAERSRRYRLRQRDAHRDGRDARNADTVTDTVTEDANN
jgi:hypothetical protein